MAPGYNLLSSSFGFLLPVGWRLVKQSALKGNQSVNKSYPLSAKGTWGRRKDAGGTQLFPGLEKFKEAERPTSGLWNTEQGTGFKHLLGDALL